MTAPITAAAPCLRTTFFAPRARQLHFPHEGILGQSAQAKKAAMNATIGIALEDDGGPMHLPSLGRNVALPPNDVFPYAGSFGVPALREAWMQQMRQKNPSLSAPCSLPVVAAGITHALSVAVQLFADETIPILIPTPGWDNYRLIANVAGAAVRPYRVFNEHDAFDPRGLEEALQTVKRACVILNFPLNPTGTVPTHDEALALIAVLRSAAECGGHYVVIVDDAYAGFVFDDAAYGESLFSLLADAHPHLLAVKADGASKEDFAWGLRVAFLTFACPAAAREALDDVADAAAAAVRASVSNACLLSQQLLLHAYRSPTVESERAERQAILQRRYALACRAARRPAYATSFTMLPCQGGYFLCLRPANGINAEILRNALLRDEGVGVIALEGLIRVAFSSLADADIDRVFERIHRASQQLLLKPT